MRPVYVIWFIHCTNIFHFTVNLYKSFADICIYVRVMELLPLWKSYLSVAVGGWDIWSRDCMVSLMGSCEKKNTHTIHPYIFATIHPYHHAPLPLYTFITTHPCHYTPLSLYTLVTIHPCHYTPLSLYTLATIHPYHLHPCHYTPLSP